MKTMMQNCRMPLMMMPMALCASAGLAGTPGVLAHVPDSTEVYVVVPNVGGLLGDLAALNTALAGKLPPDAAAAGMGLFFAQSIVNQPGFDAGGSAAVMLKLPEGGLAAGEEPEATILLPISDLESFTKAPFMAGQGATFDGGVASLNMDGQPLHMRDLGDYTVASNNKDAVMAFEAGEYLAAHTKALGEGGAGAVEASDLMVVGNLGQLDGLIGELMSQMEQQMNFMAMMGGGDQVMQGFRAIESAMTTVREDGSVGMLSIDTGADGIAFDMGVSFKEGTESAATFNAPSDSGALLGALPNDNFLMAYSLDSSADGLRGLLSKMAEMQQAQAGGMDMGWAATLEHATGASGMVGTPAAAMGGAGLLSKQITYTRAADTTKAVAAMANSLGEMDGQSMMGMKYATSYDADGGEVAGVKVGTYSIKTSMDNSGGAGGGSPMGMMMDPAMINSMLFGMSGGPSGYVAPVDGGYYTTMSKNSELLTAAMEAGKAGEGLGASELLQKVQSKLQPGRFSEAYVSLDQVFNTIGPFAQMMGMVDAFEPMEAMQPMGLSAAATGGGLRARMYWPADTLGNVIEFASQFEDAGGMGGGMGGGDSEPDF